MQVDDLVARIRRLSPDQRKKVEEVVRSLEQAPPGAPANELRPGSQKAGLPPLRGLVRDLGPAPSEDEIDEARRELWAAFPREDLP